MTKIKMLENLSSDDGSFVTTKDKIYDIISIHDDCVTFIGEVPGLKIGIDRELENELFVFCD